MVILINNHLGQVRHISAYRNPIDIARYVLQYSSKHLPSQTGNKLLKELRFNLLSEDEIYENVSTINPKYITMG